MSTASGTKSKLRETLKQEDAALAQRSRTVRTAATAAKPTASPATAIGPSASATTSTTP